MLSFCLMRLAGSACQQTSCMLSLIPGQVYDRLYYVPFHRIATLSPEISNLTLTVGSAGKNFYATGWRVGWLIGPEQLIKYVSAAHTRISYSSVSPLQEAAAIGFEKADQLGFWEASKKEMQSKMKRFNEIFDELGLSVCHSRPPCHVFYCSLSHSTKCSRAS